MKRPLSLAAFFTCAAVLVSCAKPQPPVHVHHYHTKRTTSTTKSASVGGGSSPEGFQAVTPPPSYSR